MTRFAVWLGSFGICATVGGMAGALTGLIFGAMLKVLPIGHIPLSAAAFTGALLGVVAWIFVLWVFTTVGRYVFGDIAVPALFTSVLVSIIVALAVDVLGSLSLSMLLGWIIGFAIGAALCRLCGIAMVRRAA
jgi:hypothetical protein